MLPEKFVDDVISHMNTDHSDSLRDYAIAFGGLSNPGQVELSSIDESHMVLSCKTDTVIERITIPLLNPVTRPEQLRGILVAMARRAREQISRDD